MLFGNNNRNHWLDQHATVLPICWKFKKILSIQIRLLIPKVVIQFDNGHFFEVRPLFTCSIAKVHIGINITTFAVKKILTQKIVVDEQHVHNITKDKLK